MPDLLDSKYDLAANTYTAKEQSFAVCEVGDAKQPMTFYPQVKIRRWDNECNFSARLVHEEASPEVSLVDDKIQWAGDAVEAHFYEIGKGKEGGGYEFEIILKEPPRSNVISMTLQTKGLDFFYQPELTQEEIERGAERPENVVGSYAVYHQTMAGNYEAMAGKNYLAGKAFHIYRPRIEDAKGHWVWGELNIDESTGLLTVTIPQDFLDKAVYPVRHAAGLEFGYHTVGASESSVSGNYLNWEKASSTPVSNGQLTSISAYAKILAGAPEFETALYSDVSSLPSARLASIYTGGTLIGAAYSWVETPLSYASIIAGTQYWLGIISQNNTNTFYIRYDSGGSERWRARPGSWPDSAGSTGGGTSKTSIFATYTPSATGQATAKRFGGVPHMALNRGVW